LPVNFEISSMQMLSLIEAFPQQLAEAIEIARNSSLRDLDRMPQHVIITGLGGSGIGGSIVAEFAAHEGKIPVHVCKEYHLPAWVTEQSLVILSSYSGDTEETLATFHQAVERKAQVICISSGGTISSLAKEHGFNLIQIPGGNPPRACLGYSLVQLLGIFERYGWIENALQSVENARQHMVEKSASYKREAESIAKAIAFSTPVIYTCAGYEGVAIRFRQQLNENAKMLCWHHVIPEMNHNELVGWADKNPKIAALFFRNDDDYYRSAKRMDICLTIISSKAGKFLEINSIGTNRLERMLYWIHLGDWISWFASVERSVDAMEINVINRLKAELANLQ